ncbi:hypothetical protein C8Q73DRAFT_676774 [Cubamyces lactineus]|nr:hypothetical protein C8Q73DRAFT_676774 [Cubamyces lactineus]
MWRVFAPMFPPPLPCIAYCCFIACFRSPLCWTTHTWISSCLSPRVTTYTDSKLPSYVTYSQQHATHSPSEVRRHDPGAFP